MPAAPEHARAPEVARAALKEATDLFGRLLAAAIRDGTERGVATLLPEHPDARRPTRRSARMEGKRLARHVRGLATKDQCGVWGDKRREARHASGRDPQRAQADPLAPEPRPRPATGQFTIMDLGPDTCRFPFGDGPFLFCGAAPMPGKPYCAGCMRGLYRSPDPDDEEALAAS